MWIRYIKNTNFRNINDIVDVDEVIAFEEVGLGVAVRKK